MWDLGVRRGADIASDHHLLITTLKLKLKKHWVETTTKRQKSSNWLLKDTQKGGVHAKSEEQIPSIERTEQ